MKSMKRSNIRALRGSYFGALLLFFSEWCMVEVGMDDLSSFVFTGLDVMMLRFVDLSLSMIPLVTEIGALPLPKA